MLPITLVSLMMWFWLLFLASTLAFQTTKAHRVFKAKCYDENIANHVFESKKDTRPLWILTSFKKALDAHRNGLPAQNIFTNFERQTISYINRNLIILSVLTSIAPLLGLLGTVFGMIETFSIMAHTSQSGPENLSGGISQALISTQFGLMIALPGVLGLTWIIRKRNLLTSQFSNARLHLSHIIQKGAVKT